jgi:hypothetical protein
MFSLLSSLVLPIMASLVPRVHLGLLVFVSLCIS